MLTPHPGELARLLNKNAKDIQANRLLAIEKTIEKFPAWVILKGYRTLLASPEINNTSYIDVNPTGNPGMARGGMGDVLAGLLAARLATVKTKSISETDPRPVWRKAIQSAVYIHGLAGDLAEKDVGEHALLPRDLLQKLPDAIKQCVS